MKMSVCCVAVALTAGALHAMAGDDVLFVANPDGTCGVIYTENGRPMIDLATTTADGGVSVRTHALSGGGNTAVSGLSFDFCVTTRHDTSTPNPNFPDEVTTCLRDETRCYAVEWSEDGYPFFMQTDCWFSEDCYVETPWGVFPGETDSGSCDGFPDPMQPVEDWSEDIIGWD